MIKQALLLILLSCGGKSSGSTGSRAVGNMPVDISNLAKDIKNQLKINISQEVVDILTKRYKEDPGNFGKYKEDIVEVITKMATMQEAEANNYYGKADGTPNINTINKIVEIKVNAMVKLLISKLTLEDLKELSALYNDSSYKIDQKIEDKFDRIIKDMEKEKIEIEL